MLTLLASTHAAAPGFVEESGGQATGIPVSKGQLDFYKANQAEIDQLNAQRKAAVGADDENDAEK